MLQNRSVTITVEDEPRVETIPSPPVLIPEGVPSMVVSLIRFLLQIFGQSGIRFAADVQRPPADSDVVGAAGALLFRAHELAGRPGATVTSWFRDATRNLAAGGAQASLHLVGAAFDLRVDAAGARTAASWRALGGRVLDETRSARPHWHLDLL